MPVTLVDWSRPAALLALAAFLAALALTPAPAAARRATEQPRSHPLLESSSAFRDYTVRIWRDRPGCGGAFFDVTAGRKLMYQSHRPCDAVLRVGALRPDDPDERLIAIGSDVTGDGKPDLVVSAFSGGTDCCLTYYIFELGPTEFRIIDVINALHDDPATQHFVRLEPGGLQIVVHDWTFANWHASFGRAPAPLVILHYRNGHFVPAPELMRESPPAPAQLQAKANRIRLDVLTANFHDSTTVWPDAKIPTELWGTMLDYIYAGHADLAWKFADLAWPAGMWGKRRFIAEFKRQLAQSPYWPGIRAMQTAEQDGVKPVAATAQ
jgi:hypothetical protein